LELTTTIAHKLVSALVCDAEKNFIAAGIENPEDGAGLSPVYVWYVTYLLTAHSNPILIKH